MIWGTGYVVLKWTIGIWLFRRAKQYLAQRCLRPASMATGNRFSGGGNGHVVNMK